MTKSSSSSSTSRTARCSGASCIGPGVHRQIYDLEPVARKALNDLTKPSERDGLRDERVHPEVVRSENVLVVPRRGQHYDRYVAELGVGLDLGKRFATVFLR